MADTAVLIIRAWIEPSGALRARLVATDDVTSGAATTTAAASIDEVCAKVRRWLDGLAAGP